MLVSSSCRYSMSYDISISLLKKMFIRHIFVKALGKGETPFCLLQSNHGQSYMTNSHLLGSTLRVPQNIPVPRQYPPSTSSGINSIFLKTFCKTKTRHRLSMAIPTVHDQGLSYSNKLHSVEVVHFTHTI
jgi:hypothetical protein